MTTYHNDTLSNDQLKAKLRQLDPKFKKPFRLYTDSWMTKDVARACWVPAGEYEYILIKPDGSIRLLAESEYQDYNYKSDGRYHTADTQ